jgi:reactive intermediate/imine deaminase
MGMLTVAVAVLALCLEGQGGSLNHPPSDAPIRQSVTAGDLVYASGILPVDAAGLAIDGDVKQQTRRVLERLSVVLAEAGSSIGNAASVTVYLRRPADFASMNEVYRTFWPENPPARTTVAADLELPGALVAVSAVGIRNRAERNIVHPADWVRSPSPYSYAIKSGDTLFLSGLLARRGRDNSLAAGDMASQTRTVMENAGELLREAGMSFTDVVSARVYITDAAAFQEMNAAYRAYFPAAPPARATVVTELMAPEFLVEIAMVAVAGGDRTAISTPAADGSPGRANPNLSSAIRVGNRLYLSGMLGNNETNKGDAADQTRETLARIGRTLNASGFDWSHLVDGVVYLTDMSRAEAMDSAYRQVLEAPYPARTTVGTRLVSPDGLVEIMFVAVK